MIENGSALNISDWWVCSCPLLDSESNELRIPALLQRIFSLVNKGVSFQIVAEKKSK